MTEEHDRVEQPSSVTFSYIKSNFFRVVHSDGAVGGVTPRGNIHLAFYSERPAIPRVMTQEIVDGALGEPSVVDGSPGITRELDVDIILTADVAIELRNFLTRNLQSLKDAIDSEDGQLDV